VSKEKKLFIVYKNIVFYLHPTNFICSIQNLQFFLLLILTQETSINYFAKLPLKLCKRVKRKETTHLIKYSHQSIPCYYKASPKPFQQILYVLDKIYKFLLLILLIFTQETSIKSLAKLNLKLCKSVKREETTHLIKYSHQSIPCYYKASPKPKNRTNLIKSHSSLTYLETLCLTS
jgi:hypothetical protein